MAINYMPHTYVTYHGVLGETATAEQTWSFGVRVDLNEADWLGYLSGSGDPVAGYLVPMAAAFTDNFAEELFTDSVWFTSMKAAVIQADGTYAMPPFQYHLATPWHASGTSRHDFQRALVITWRHMGLGTGNYGRMYLPPIEQDPGQDGRVTAAYAAARRDNALSMWADINTAGEAIDSSHGHIHIYSRTAGTKKVIDNIGCGRVVDTQRRRRDQLAEDIQWLY